MLDYESPYTFQMPCSCQIPGPAYPENKEWGPFVWNILHGLAERTTRIITPLYENDESRAWISLLQTTGNMLPCSDCREHYAEWLAEHPVIAIKNIPRAQLREWIRHWLYDLHQNINIRLGKTEVWLREPCTNPTGFGSEVCMGFTFEDLTPRYAAENVSMNFKLFELIEKRAIQQQGVNLKAWLDWVKHYRTLTSVYGIS